MMPKIRDDLLLGDVLRRLEAMHRMYAELIRWRDTAETPTGRAMEMTFTCMNRTNPKFADPEDLIFAEDVQTVLIAALANDPSSMRRGLADRCHHLRDERYPATPWPPEQKKTP